MIAKQQQRQQQTQPMGETVNKPVIKGSCGSSRIWNQINSCVASVVGEKKKGNLMEPTAMEPRNCHQNDF